MTPKPKQERVIWVVEWQASDGQWFALEMHSQPATKGEALPMLHKWRKKSAGFAYRLVPYVRRVKG